MSEMDKSNQDILAGLFGSTNPKDETLTRAFLAFVLQLEQHDLRLAKVVLARTHRSRPEAELGSIFGIRWTEVDAS